MKRITEFFSRPQVWGFFVSVIVMAVISLAFFYPDNFEGNSLSQPDMQQGAANGHEGLVYQAETGEKALWTNSLFGGMPTFQISPSYPSNSLFSWIDTVYGLGLPAPSDLLFMMMFGFLILLFCLKVRWYYALIGAVAWGFSSYFIIIIGAGHLWKFLALTYAPPMIGGLVLIYQGRRLAGAALLALAGMMQLNANHPQITYYFALLGAILAVCYLVAALRSKDRVRAFKDWLVCTAVTIGAALLAVGANMPSLYHTYEYSKETKRAGSELTETATADQAGEQTAERPTGGLPHRDIVGWSYGRTEMLSLFIPDIKGGASARPEGGRMVPMSLTRLEGGETAAQKAPIIEYLTQYFNNSEGTNGPVYVGVIIFVLFLVGCFIVRGPLKWGLLAGTLFSVLLALGYNFEWLTDLMIYHFPLYNKFRAVESILVVAEFTIPLLAILALVQLVEEGAEALRTRRKALCWSFGMVATFCVIGLAFPSAFGSAITDTDQYTSTQIQQQIVRMAQSRGYDGPQISEAAYAYSLTNPVNLQAVETLRYGMVRSDALRSLLFLLLGAGVLYLLLKGTVTRAIGIAGLGVLVLADLYNVDKRYLSHDSFTPGSGSDSSAGLTFIPDRIDSEILADGQGSVYRVLDIPAFYSANRSYFHHTLGGYHAAKLNRYEDIIRHKLQPVLDYGYFPDDPALDDPEVAAVARVLRNGYAVADMLNARYVVTGEPDVPVVRNSHALGNAWLVDSLIFVDGANAEMDALDVERIDLHRQAVADRRFSDVLTPQPPVSAGDTIYLTEYTPNRLTYHAESAAGSTAVFSEIWFPWGWHAEVDGTEVTLGRANYILRALTIPAGTHTVTMTFRPASLAATGAVAYACVTVIYLLLLTAVFFELRRCRVL